MILIFRSRDFSKVYALESSFSLTSSDIQTLRWLFHEAEFIEEGYLKGRFIGPRREMITPFSTNAVEITQIMGISGIRRIEEFRIMKPGDDYDRMLEAIYENLHQDIFRIDRLPAPVEFIEDIAAYNEKAGLALRKEEIEYLEEEEGEEEEEVERRPATRPSTKKNTKTKKNLLPKIAWSVVGLLVLRLICMVRGVWDYFATEGDIREKQSELKSIRDENKSLKTEITRIQTDKNYQRLLAKDHLGVIAADEFLILFAGESSDSTSDEPNTSI